MQYRMYKDTLGHWRWRLVAANSRIIADSGESYWNRADCQAAINLVKNSSYALIYEV